MLRVTKYLKSKRQQQFAGYAKALDKQSNAKLVNMNLAKLLKFINLMVKKIIVTIIQL